MTATGDSGTCVIDAVSNQLYGYVAFGHPGDDVVYIISAIDAFEDMHRRFKRPVRVRNERGDFRSPFLPQQNPNTYESMGDELKARSALNRFPNETFETPRRRSTEICDTPRIRHASGRDNIDPSIYLDVSYDRLRADIKHLVRLEEEETARKAAEEKAKRDLYIAKWRMEEAERKAKEEARLKEEEMKFEEKTRKLRLVEAERELRLKEEEMKFEEKIRKKFLAAGYSAAHVDSILWGRKSHEGSGAEIDVDRPVYIRVRRKYIHPDTLKAYNLPWEFQEVR